MDKDLRCSQEQSQQSLPSPEDTTSLYMSDEIRKDLECKAIPAANYRSSTWSGSSMTSNLDVNNPKIKLNLSRYGILISHFFVRLPHKEGQYIQLSGFLHWEQLSNL
jgi:hypothetical protein